MASRAFPFGLTRAPRTSVLLNAVQREVESWQDPEWTRYSGGGTFKGSIRGLARRHGVEVSAIRKRLQAQGLPTPDTAANLLPGEDGSPPGINSFKLKGATVRRFKKSGESPPAEVREALPDPVPEVREALPDPGRGTAQSVGAQETNDTGSQEHGGEVYTPSELHTIPVTPPAPPITSNLQQYNPRQAAELSALAQAEHDFEIAQLVTDSIKAFRKGKAKGPGGRRVIPIQKVGDLQIMDTLYRRATGQAKGDGPSRGNLIQVNVLNRISRETVKPEGEGTSRIVDVKGTVAES